MKIDAFVEVHSERHNMCINCIVVPVDVDYVESNEQAVLDWIRESKELDATCKKYGFLASEVKLVVHNMNDILEDLAYDEFDQKTDNSQLLWK